MDVSAGIEVCGESMLEQACPEGWQPVARTAVEQGKSVGRKEEQRGAVMGAGFFCLLFLTIQHYFNSQYIKLFFP